MRLFFLITLLSISLFSLNAQESAIKKYQANSIYLQTGFGGLKYVKEGQVQRIGFMGNKLKQEMQVSPNAIIEFKKYQKNRWISIGLSVASGVLLVSSISDGEFKSTPYWLGLGTTMMSGLFGVHSFNKRGKSIWIYNHDTLK